MKAFDLKHERESLWYSLAELAARRPIAVADFPVVEFAEALQRLYVLDRFWTFPGRGVLLRLSYYLQHGQFALIAQLLENCCHRLASGSYRQQPFIPFQTNLEQLDRPLLCEQNQLESVPTARPKPYFEVLVVHPMPDEYEMLYRQQLAAQKSPYDEFIYDIVLVDSAEDALTAILSNTDIQACVYLNHVPPATPASTPLFETYSRPLIATTPPLLSGESVEVNLCRTIRCLRPELDHFLISEQSPGDLPLATRRYFNRVLFHVHPFQELHAEILNGVRNRFSAPFFEALQAYSRQPKGVFHALPISRGASVKDSPWIHDTLDFYGNNIFLAETSSTQGGLDSLLDPTGAIKQAQKKAAETFGADHSYFVTNGTSTSNKIVMQANLRPGDIVLVSADCHKSIPYSVMLTGACPVFLETYPLAEHDLYGGVDLAQIKAVMLDLQTHGLLSRLKLIALTNSTFDGLVYHCEHFMQQLLTIKPDLIFHWDEAWSAFAYFHPLYHSRTAMSAVHKIRQRLASSEYRAFHAHWAAEFAASEAPEKWQQTLYPDPDRVQLRVYATQSTHKTLSAFRQGSMIHIADDAFDQRHFIEAYRIHTCTSPNYQIIASLDTARRQAALEGFHRVRQAILLALQLRQRIRESDLLKPYFAVLGDDEMVPEIYRAGALSGSAGLEPQTLSELAAHWGASDFVIDPTRVTLDISRTGFDGSGFRQLLMTRYDIQVNKTSRNTVLFLINIGATQATVDYLVQVLHEIASLFELERKDRLPATAESSVVLPGKRVFHPAFRPMTDGDYPVCDLRSAYFLGGDESNVDYVPLSVETQQEVEAGRILVSACFVTPYPPGFPLIVPGQLITGELLCAFLRMRIGEIHGFDGERGFRVFKDDYLTRLASVHVQTFLGLHQAAGTTVSGVARTSNIE